MERERAKPKEPRSRPVNEIIAKAKRPTDVNDVVEEGEGEEGGKSRPAMEPVHLDKSRLYDRARRRKNKRERERETWLASRID